jgi:hypothetical protein
MDLDPNIAPDMGSDITPIQLSASATAMASITAMDSNTGRNTEGLVQPDTDGLDPNICPDSGSDIAPIRPSGSATAIASNLEEGMTMPLDPNITSDTGSNTMDMTTATDTAKDSESLDPNIAPDKGSDTVPIQLSASATARASVTATHLKQTLDSYDNDSRFSKGSSSEENEFTDDDDVTKAKKNENLRYLHHLGKKDCL